MNFKAVYLRLFLIVFPCIFFINIQGFAQNLNQYQQYLQHKERQHLMETLPPPSSNVQVNQDQAPALHGKACVHINSIIVVNTQNLSQLPVKHITRPWQNKCMSLDDMNTVLNKLNKAYIDHGFVTTRAYLPQQDLKSGQLHIVVVDGKISDFQFEGVSAKNHETMAFPWVKGGILNLRDLEQGMDQMNRLPDWAATMKIAPGQKPGTSVVKINAHDPGILHGQLTVDNNGQSYSGRTIGRTMVTAEDLFGLLDMWTVEYDHSLNSRQGDGHNSFFTAEGSIPLGPWTFFGGWYRYDDFYRLHFNWPGQGRYDTTQKDFHIGASRVVARNSIGVTTLQATYELKSFDSYLNHSKMNTQSAKLSFLNLNASESMHLWGGTWYVSVGMKIGLGGAMGGKSWIDNSGRYNPHTQYVKPSLDIDGYQPIVDNFMWHTSIHGEYSTKNQYANEQMQIGGPYTVRGFMQQTMIGNAGIYMRNDLSWFIPTKNMDCGGYQFFCNALIKNTELYGILDVGMTRGVFTYSDMPKTEKGGNLAGAGFGIRKSSGNIFWNASLTHALTTAGLPPEGWIALFNVGVRL